MSTPHISAEKGDFAKTVLMPGDPLRAKYIAQTYLKDAVEVTAVRGNLGYTGMYHDVKVSVMASGMGIPSIGIYSHELYKFYDVENIIRIGTAGSLQETLQLRDMVAAIGAHTNSNFAAQYELNGTFAPTADYTLLSTAVEAAKKLGYPLHVGNILTADNFYEDNPETFRRWASMGTLAVEMEAAGLYITAARLHKRALAITTISDKLLTGEACSIEERMTAFTRMMEVALETAVQMERISR